jgi:hypothetical protein
MKPGDLVRITFRRRRSNEILPIGILLEIRPKEYPLRGERELDYIVLSRGSIRTLSKRYLRLIDEFEV